MAALSEARLRRALIVPGGFWRDVRVAGQTGSTNADLLAAAAGGAPEGSVLAAEAQTAGRGRMGRRWVAPPGAALTFSVLLRPAVPPARLGWVPLLAGVAAAAALRSETGVDARLKWPNDVLVRGRKLAGVLSEQRAGAVVVGIGVNVSQRAAELPAPGATSLLLELAGAEDRPSATPPGAAERGGLPGRERLLIAVLGELARWRLAWGSAAARGDPDACGLRDAYRRLCATLGREVRAELPGARAVTGTAADVDAGGRLVVRARSGSVAVSAGDVVHLR